MTTPPPATQNQLGFARQLRILVIATSLEKMDLATVVSALENQMSLLSPGHAFREVLDEMIAEQLQQRDSHSDHMAGLCPNQRRLP